VDIENIPAPQLMHEDEPEALWYCPLTQLAHVDTEVAPTLSEKVPLLQGEQLDAPGLGL